LLHLTDSSNFITRLPELLIMLLTKIGEEASQQPTANTSHK